MTTDLSTLIAMETTKVEVLHPVTKKPTGMSVTLAGPAADAYQSAKLRLVQENMGEANAEKIGQKMVELLAACVVGWEGFVEHGQALACTPENVLRLLTTRGYYWLKDQLEAALGDVARFIKA